MRLKDVIQHAIDCGQFWFDTDRHWLYQPLPWLGVDNARRGDGTRQRWHLIARDIRGRSIETAMDIGCHAGFFCFALADIGIKSLGVDADARAMRVASFVARRRVRDKQGKRSFTSFAYMTVSPDTVALLPNADLVLLLSIWHHYVRAFGITGATEILAAIWHHCLKLMYFETGEREVAAAYDLPDMGPDAKQWILDYLRSTCDNAQVEHVGTCKAFAPGGDEHHRLVYRNLYRLERLAQT